MNKTIADCLRILEEQDNLLAQIKDLLDQRDKIKTQIQVYKLIYGPLDDKGSE